MSHSTGNTLRPEPASDVAGDLPWPLQTTRRSDSPRMRWWRSPVVAAAAAAALLTGATAAAAAGLLPIFSTEAVAPLEVNEAELVQLPDLESYGQFRVAEEADLGPVASPQAAQEATGLTAPAVRELPQGVSEVLEYRVGQEVRARFTFDAEVAAAAAENTGRSLPPPPPGLDGARFELVAGPGVATVWRSTHGAPALLAARAEAPRVSSSGVPFEEAADYLLSMPGLPDGLAAELRGLADQGSTLPIPLPAERVDTRETTLDGVPVTVVTAKEEPLTALVWVQDGVIGTVVGSVNEQEVLSVGRQLIRQGP